MSELYDILVETPPTKVILLALDQGLWDCERSLAELAALCEANHMEAVAEVTQKRQTPETGIVLGSGKLEEAAAAAAELGAEPAVAPVKRSSSLTAATSTPASTHWLRNWPRWKSAGARAGKPAPRPECRWSASWATPTWANPA